MLAAFRQHAPSLDQGGIELRQERFLALPFGFLGYPGEMAQDAAVEEREDLDYIAIGKRLDGLEDRPLERARAGIDPVADQGSKSCLLEGASRSIPAASRSVLIASRTGMGICDQDKSGSRGRDR